MAERIVIGLFDAIGTAEDVRNRLVYEGVPETDIGLCVLKETEPLPSSMVAYWPMEDPSGSTQIASALTNGSPMVWTGTPTLASYEGAQASDTSQAGQIRIWSHQADDRDQK